MSKVLVDRELLEMIEQLLDILPESKTIRMVRELLAQPAEAEVAVTKIECTTCRGTGSLEFEGGAVVKDCAPCKGTGRDLKAERYALAARLSEAIAALSAVTAERDRLLQEKGDPAGSFEKCMQAMRDRDEHARTIDRLRAEVERLRRQLQTAHSFIESTEAFGSAAASGILECAGAVWNIDESKALIAAMAAKEA